MNTKLRKVIEVKKNETSTKKKLKVDAMYNSMYVNFGDFGPSPKVKLKKIINIFIKVFFYVCRFMKIIQLCLIKLILDITIINST